MAGDLIYLDTSGVLAYLDADDASHESAAQAWTTVIESDGSFVMTDWVRLECWSLIQRRLGLEAVTDFQEKILAQCTIDPVGEAGFDLLARQVVVSRRRDLSLVDLSSFDCMRRRGIRRAVAFDKHFVEQGFITPDVAEW